MSRISIPGGGSGGGGGSVTDSAMAGALGTATATAMAARAELKAAFVPRWQANTAYAQGDAVLNPSGQMVTANSAFASSSSYNASNWTITAGGTGTSYTLTDNGDGTFTAAGVGATDNGDGTFTLAA